ncbi:outer membrane beta-barrel protein [uncultured Muribaculum sp.]|uniref:outer membrane beta-barrel protein n=1 Tax=uncultured Muribaculum sp. TaxID=1918613 RepID=UPI0027310FF0|nr:outer membrane beta-barrel protein [uncultured Muribaculum sp.]
MKAILITILMFLIAILAMAQETVDTMATQQLQEIVIQAPKVIHKADMDLYYPSQSAVDNSKNGVQLLNNLMIPSLAVMESLGTIQAAGQTVQVRINGRESTIDQVKTLLPETIKRVEWIDNPGLRYKGANYVLNFVVSNPTIGGSLMTNVMPALNQAWGNYFADLKFNSGRSQFEIWGKFKLTNRIKSHRDYNETFTYPDGTSLTRDETSRGGIMDNTMGNFTASYSYINPDTTVLMVDLSCHRKFTDKFTYNGLLSLSNGMDDILLTDMHGDKGTKPYLSVYFEQHFANKQMLVVDFNSSFYFGRSYSDYIEQLPDAAEYLTDIHTMIKDRNQAYGLEADYIKSWKNSRFTAGVSYAANRNRSVYENLGGEIFHQRQDKVYFFAEYFQRIKKFTLTAGMGAHYTDFMFKESNQGSNSWNMRPQATVTYGINQNNQFKLSFETWQSTPSLAETNIAPQQLDGFQWRIGNPNLKTSNSYMLTLRYNFNVPRVAGLFGIRAFTSPNAITPLLYWDNDRLITTYENSRGLKNLSFFIAPQIDIIPKWLMLSGYLQYRMERMCGTGYKLHNYNWSGNANLRVMHWGFVFSAQYMRAQHDLWGEKISWGENISVIDLSYNWKDWQFGAGMIMPFGKYDQGSKMLSKWNTNEQHMRLDMRMLYLSISYNLQWGHQKRSAQRRIKADANVDTSTAGGR